MGVKLEKKRGNEGCKPLTGRACHRQDIILLLKRKRKTLGALPSFGLSLCTFWHVCGQLEQGVWKKKIKDTMLYFLIKDLEDPPLLHLLN